MGECEPRTQGAFVAGGYGRERGRRIAPPSAAGQPVARFERALLIGPGHEDAPGAAAAAARASRRGSPLSAGRQPARGRGTPAPAPRAPPAPPPPAPAPPTPPPKPAP